MTLPQLRLLLACAAHHRAFGAYPGVAALRDFLGCHIVPKVAAALVAEGLLEVQGVVKPRGGGKTKTHVVTEAGWRWIESEAERKVA